MPELIWNIANALTGGGADYYVIRDAVNAIGTAWQSVQGGARHVDMAASCHSRLPSKPCAVPGQLWPAIQEAFAGHGAR